MRERIFRRVVLSVPMRGNITVTQTERRSRLPLKVRGERCLRVMERMGIPKVLGAFTLAGILLPWGFTLRGTDKNIVAGLTLVAIGGTSFVYLVRAWEHIAKRHMDLRIFLTATVLLGLAVPSWELAKKPDAEKGTVKVEPTLSHEEPKPEQPKAEIPRTVKKKPSDSQRREEMAAALEGDLRGAGEVFDDGKLRITPLVQIGTTESIFMLIPSNQLEPYFKPFRDVEFRVEFGRRGPVVSTTVRDSGGHIVATLNKNHWRVYPPFCQEKNYTEDALEILDSSLHVVLQVKLLLDRVQVQGEWWDNQGHGQRISKSPDPKRGQVAPLGPQIKRNEALIQPMFKYPSKHHWQELVAK
jgi:hypothetical protein